MSSESINQKRHELEIELERSEQRTRMLIQAIPLALLIIDARANILCINPQASWLLGWMPNEAARKKLPDLIDCQKLEFPLPANFSSTIFETPVTTKDGRTVFVEASLSSLSEESAAWLVSLKDITERHKIEIFKQNIVQMLSHDLRSPLASLSVFLDIVVDERLGPVPDSLKKQGSIAQSSCNRLLNLVEDLLKVETLSAGELELERKLVLTDSILLSAKNSVLELSNSKGVNLEIVGKDIEVYCDEERLVQVLVNFMSNALKFSPAGETIKVEAKELPDGVEFSVNDRGPGIPEAEAELVFERFFQGTNNGAGSGFGLGLTICREIVSAHDGQIGVRKNGEKGASFWFRIPSLVE